MSYGKTDPGVRRPNNEDHFDALDDLGLYLVADGLGGEPAGEIASDMAVTAAATAVRQAAAASPAVPLPELLGEAVRRANLTLLEAGEREPSWRGMATTLSMLLLERDRAHVAHVGDCRIYRWRAGEPLTRLTRDHSQAQVLVDRGILTEAQAARHPWSHQLERALGIEGALDVDVSSEPRRPGDRFLLCSDGLIRVVTEEEITAMLAGPLDPRAQVEQLVALARERGAPDNVTVIVVHGGWQGTS